MESSVRCASRLRRITSRGSVARESNLPPRRVKWFFPHVDELQPNFVAVETPQIRILRLRCLSSPALTTRCFTPKHVCGETGLGCFCCAREKIHCSRRDNDQRLLRSGRGNLPLMPPYQQFSSVTLEELPVDNYEVDSLLGSDDDLDDTARAAKRRRIETLGKLYLQGNPLFIASASLRGPFDNGWVNPWKRNRSRAPATNRKRAASPANGNMREVEDSEKMTKSIPSSTDCVCRANQQGHSASSTPAEFEKQKRDSPFIVESLDSRMTEPPSAKFSVRHQWLKKDRRRFNIQNYDPPKSPSSRYAGVTKRRQPLDKKPEPSHIQDISSSRTKSRDKQSTSTLRSSPNGSSSPSNFPGFPDCEHPHQGSNGKKNLTASSTSFDDSKSINCERVEPTSSSSVRIIPPSSHLPEFKYRLPKSKSAKQPTVETGQSILKNKTDSTDDFLANPTNEREYPPLQSALGDSSSRQASVQTKKDSGTLEALGHNDEPESDEITSAQIVPQPLPQSGQIISLYSTDLRGALDADENAGVGGGELSTQEALHLAQKSFREEFSTPERDLEEDNTETKELYKQSSRITPFSRINAMTSKLEIKLATGAGPEAIQSMDTQALIDAVTPFSVRTTKNAGIESNSRSHPNASAPDLSQKRRTALAVSPRLSPAGNHMQVAPARHTQISDNDSFSALPLTLSVTTPATEPPDGQGLMAGSDAFNLSQVIQDAGSWLQQSFDVGKDLKRSSQSSTQAIRREVTPT